LRTSTRKKRSEEEIREIQERKNQYVLMSEIHQKMNAFHQGLLDASKQNEQSQSNIESKFVALSSRFQNLSELVDLKFKDLVDRIGKAESLSLVVSSKLRSLESILSFPSSTRKSLKNLCLLLRIPSYLTSLNKA